MVNTSTYECLSCGSIIKTEEDKLISKCPSCGKSKINKLAGDFDKEEDFDFFEIQKHVLQDIITRREEHATERIVSFIDDKNFIYTTRDDIKSEIWIYDNGIYKPNGESYIKEIVRKFLEHTYTPQRANKVIAKIEADTMIDTDKFFNVNYINEIPVDNGILNIKTRELSKYTPEKIFFNKLPISYNPEAECPNIEKFLNDILKNKNDVSIIFELFGYTLLKDHPIEKAFMLVGSGRNGKGKLLSLMKSFLGGENCCSVSLSQINSSSSSVCELFGKLVNLSGDLSNTALRETGLFKEVTGRDMIGAKRKYLRDLFFVNYSKQIFACNELPRVYDFSRGFWSRWVLLEFPYEFMDKAEYDSAKDKTNLKIRNTNIIDNLTTPGELSGLLNFAIDGLDRLLTKQDFSYSKGADDVKNFWIRKSDSFTAFCLDCIENDFEGFVSKKELRRVFNKYCKEHKVKGTSDKNIKVVLEDMFGVVEGRKLLENGQDYVWEGIKFKIK